MSLAHVSLGAALAAIGLTAQYLIKKRLANKKVARVYMWIAWVCAALGGEAMSHGAHVGQFGVGATGATVVSIVGLLFLGVDLADKRPDWPAFFIVLIVPWFMRIAAGGAHDVFTAMLAVPAAANQAMGQFLGM